MMFNPVRAARSELPGLNCMQNNDSAVVEQRNNAETAATAGDCSSESSDEERYRLYCDTGHVHKQDIASDSDLSELELASVSSEPADTAHVPQKPAGQYSLTQLL